jgi:hypothetical protein
MRQTTQYMSAHSIFQSRKLSGIFNQNFECYASLLL